jgi:hypothetical protein
MRILFSILPATILVFCFSCSDSNEQKPSPQATQQESIHNTPSTPPFHAGLSVRKQVFSAENCDVPRTDEMEYIEDWCSKRTVELLTVSLADASVAQKINRVITQKITGNAAGIPALKAFVDKVKDQNPANLEENLFQESITCEVRDTGQVFLSFGITSDYYALGAAHGSYTVQVLNFDLRDGNIITLNQLFYPNNMVKLTQFVKRKFMQQNEGEDWWFTSGDQPFQLAEVFALEPKGLRFIYQQYEVGPYVAGLPEVFLTKEELQAWMKPNDYWKF